MDWLGLWHTFKESADTKTAMALVGIACFYVGTRLQKKVGELATKKEFELHKKQTDDRATLLEGTVFGTMQKIQSTINDHEEKDEKRFETLDKSFIPQLDIMGKQIISLRLSNARIESHLKIEPPKE